MPPKRLPKTSNDKKIVDKKNAKSDKNAAASTGTKKSDNKDGKDKGNKKESSKMTLCTKPSLDTLRPQRRPNRPPIAKKIITRDIPGKLRSNYRRSLDPCDNSNDSGLGFDHHNDAQQHTTLSSERLTWSGERAEAKRLRLDIKMEDEEANDSYGFPNSVRQCKENISIIRTAPSVSVPSLNISNNTSTTSSRTVPRGNPIISRQTPTSPVTLATQLLSKSRFGDIALTIVKQPEQQHRARYQTEGSRGAVKDRDGNGFPIVQLTGYYKPATLQVYIGTDVGKVTPHMFYQACKVSGKNSTPCYEKKIDGTCVIELALDPAKEMCATCDCVGILKERNVDVEHRFPDQLGNRNKKKSTRCRMIFRTSITHDNGTTETLQVCSQPIVCTQPPGIPEICKKSLTSCPANGGLELFVLGKNFLKDTKVFFQQYEGNRLCWEQSVAPDKEYLQQTHFVCVVPPYRRPNITEPITVRLCVMSSGKTSESQHFVYTPVNGPMSVQMESQHAPPSNQFFKGSVWNSRKREQDLDMMPPPESSLVPVSTRRSSISLPSASDSHSPPMHVLKQEYIDENSQSSIPDVLDIHRERYRPISESSLDVNHDSNISMINDNSIDMLHHGTLLNHIGDNSNLSVGEDAGDLVRSELPLTSEVVQAAPLNSMEKLMGVRMKHPMNATVTDYVSNASSMATLKIFGIEPTSAPLPTQSGQSVENYLTKIESKASLLPPVNIPSTSFSSLKADKVDMITAPPATAQSMFLATQQPFLTETNVASTIAKSEAAAIAESTMPGTTNTTSNTNTTITSALEGSISASMNSEKRDDLFVGPLGPRINSATKVSETVSSETIIAHQEVLLSSESSLLVAPVINTTITSPSILHEHHSPEIILNSQLPLLSPVVCPPTTPVGDSLLPVPQQPLLPPVTTQEPSTILNVEPEKAVLLQAAEDLFRTQKKITEITTSGMMNLTPTVTESNLMSMPNTFVPPFPTAKNPSEVVVLPVKELGTTSETGDKKHEDRMIPQSFTSLTDNELINFINPSCFDQV
ncbi:nuclear factor of activated T cells 3 isoform X2 [Rhynchophorus ferrugineus]|uniref:nuclear factor of activated T cells 3 isoform X2 n=2 Tax=Rhynchophorus ferrugineus TaxID=354439 RepID=UPI003FCE2861